MSKDLKKWSVVTGMAVAAVAVLLVGGIVGGVLSGVIPVAAQEPPVEGPPFGVRHGGGMGMGWGGHGAALDTAAEVLSMTPEDLRAELQAGKSVAEVAEEQGVDPQAVCDAIHAQAEERIQEAVADGRLTQEQANQILERMAEREGDCMEHGGMPFGLGFGGRGRSGGPGFHPHSARFGRGGWDRSGAAGCPMGFAQEQ